MKKLKKILIIVGVTLLLAVMGAVSVFASSFPLVEDDANYEDDFTQHAISVVTESMPIGATYWAFDINSYSGERFNDSSLLFYEDLQSSNYLIVFTDNFKELYIDYALENKQEIEKRENATFEFTAQSLLNFVREHCVNENYRLVDLCVSSYPDDLSFDTYCSENGVSYGVWGNSNYFLYFGVDSSYFDRAFILEYDEYIRNYALNKQLEEKDLSFNSLQNQVNGLNNVISEKDVTISALQNSVSTLNGEKAVLESNVDGLNTQVTSLALRNTELSAQIKSLENQLQLKINKAYAEGLTDSEGGLTTSGIISIIIVLSLVVAVIALVYFASRKRKIKK